MAARDRDGSTAPVRWTTERLNTVTALTFALPTALATLELTGSRLAALFVAFVLGVTVPYSYTTRWPGSLRHGPWRAVAWTAGACVLATAAFVVISLASWWLTDASPTLASGVAFVVVGIGGPEILSAIAEKRGAFD